MGIRSLLLLSGLSLACSTSTPDRSSVPPTAVEAPPEALAAELLPTTIEANVPVLPQGLTSFGSVEHEGILYVLGGYSGMPHAYSAKDQHGDLLAYDGSADPGRQWSVVGKVPPVQGAALVSHPRGLVRVGGMRAMNPTMATKSELVSVDVVQRFDVAQGTWSNLPALPEGRSSHDAVVLGDTLYVVGGWQLDHEAKDGAWPAEMFSLDLSKDDAQWSRSPTPFARRALAVAAAGGKLYVLGGMGSDREISQHVEVYDPATGSWTRAADFPGQGFGMAAVGSGGAVFASGSDGVVHRLDAEKGTWSAASTMALPRFFHRLIASADGTVWALGGIRPSASGTRVRLGEPVAGERVSQAISLRLPSPMPSKNRQGAAVLGDGVYFFGGNNSLGQHDFAPQNFTADAFRFDLATLKWTEIADYPQARQTMSVATHMGEIYAFGGFGHDGEVARSHPEVFVYSPEDDRWAPADGSLPGPGGRTQFGLANAEGKWWVFGGLDYDPSRAKGDQFRHEQPILSAPVALADGFSPSGASLTAPRRAFAGAKFGEQYVVVGGMKDGFALVDTCEAFEFAKATWSAFPCPSTQRLSGHLIGVGDRLALIAGSSKGADGKLVPDATIEVFEPSTGSWRTAGAELTLPPKHLHAFAWNEAALLVSAHNDAGMLDVVVLRAEAIQ
ncbi:MAG: Kelch repeat-containing protein [Nannocystales bacterium]